ncbi:MAG TPA: ABC transporter substrate-binding protein [Ktedonobacterales bacterium]|nr:ABC transporter substrate-binding protein [Ktedonobacterales bacterium]
MPFISRLRTLRRSSLLTRVAAPATLVGMLALAACGQGGGATAASAPGVDQSTITLGAVLDTTGAIKVICQPILDGDQLYINKINAAGGINGRKVKLLQVSDNGDSTKTKDAVRQLVEQDNVFAVFQVCGSGNANVAESYLGPKGIPFIDPIGGGAQFNDTSGKALPWLWMTQPNYGDEGHVIGSYATTTLKAKKVALLYEDDVLGLQQKTTLGEALTKNGASLVASVGYKYTQTDFSSAVQTLKAANPDLIVLNGLPGPTAKFILTAAQQGYKPSIGYLANYPMSDNSWAKVLGAAGEGVYVSGYADVNTAIGKQYLAETSSDTTFSAYKFYGYIMSKLMLDALSKSGANPTRASLQTALNTDFSNYDTGFGPTITWSAQQHGGISDFEFLQIKNGTLTPVSGFIKASSVWP